ncbi:hypothetical protein AJ80_05408 [Polytolypa hystricis UAMH7299]|uniref:Peptidase M20 dimerisation domain-containing protein n=1 Tax=Polytolypa hystricis (strain UAMH7299) TaxID=1447883 RepID=A0A2B7Y5F1_POLH7|nr:hypothetical protein AJ80_05408 [Polytolypa hystricis UAMH7299]
MIPSILAPLLLAPPILGFSLQAPLSAPLDPHLSIDRPDVKKSLDDIIAQSPLLSLHRSLVEIESISNNEQAVGDFLIDYLRAKNFTVETQEVKYDWEEKSSSAEDGYDDDSEQLDAAASMQDEKPRRFNVYAYPSWQQPGKPEIIVTSHIDTVPPFIPYSLHSPSASTTSSSNFKREDILIAGRGTVDAKASVASQIIATLSHLETHPNTPIALLFVVSEETGGQGMIHFSNSPLNTHPPTFHTVIFGEPTELALVSGHKGSLHVDIYAKGQAAHSGYPWLGRSAISEILPVLLKLDGLGDIPASQGGLPASEKFGNSTVNIGSITGGVAGNVVPASASASITVRLAGGTASWAKDIIVKAVDEASGGNRNISVAFSNRGYGPVETDADVEGFNVMTVNYGTDVPNWHIYERDDGVKVKRYLYGPGTIFVAHGEDEALTVGELEEAVKGFGRLIDAAVERGESLKR